MKAKWLHVLTIHVESYSTWAPWRGIGGYFARAQANPTKGDAEHQLPSSPSILARIVPLQAFIATHSCWRSIGRAAAPTRRGPTAIHAMSDEICRLAEHPSHCDPRTDMPS
jgi:hypothetical protein